MLSADDKQRIATAIGTAEARGGCEIDVATVPSSDDYAGPRAPTAGLLTIVLALALVYLVHLGPYAAVLATVVIAAALYVLLGAGPVVRLLLPAGQAELAVRRQAHALFAELVLGRTAAPRAVLVFVSLLERRAVVLVERRAGEAPGPWSRVATDLERAVRQGRLAEGTLAALDAIGGALAPRAPSPPV